MLKPSHILVVDDDPTIRDMMVDILNYEGYPISVARNGREAFDSLSSSITSEPDRSYLIFLDLMMPVMDGHAFCERLNQEPDLRKQQVVVLMSAIDRLAQATTLQVDETMPKPFVIDDVLHIIDKYR